MQRRLSELWQRWAGIRHMAAHVLTMNQRNLNYIYPYNPRRHFPLADDKILTKDLMQRAGVPVPSSYKIYDAFYQLRNLEEDLARHADFVIKPSQGSGGGGIVVIAGRKGTEWVGPGDKQFSLPQLRKHISDIIFGVYSYDLKDRCVIEERIKQSSEMSVLSPWGLADIRVIMFNDQPVLSMARLPTRASEGRANLHQGAVGVGIDLESGITNHAILNNMPTTTHPDTQLLLLGRQIPHWQEVIRISRLAASAVPLKYLGIDICIAESGPMLLEINVRPGLQIQNANLIGLRSRLDSLR
ncbi:MAG: sugar-transfer associated ATP-grasp domain-containing protein [Pseudomonadota bacterium]